jgi:hypothetical protein
MRLRPNLPDHLAGALHAIELLKAMRDHHTGEPLGRSAAQLAVAIEADRDVLAELIERTGTAPGGMKEWGAWLAEEVGRLKLKHGSDDGLGTFEALEFLVLGIHAKWGFDHRLGFAAGQSNQTNNTSMDNDDEVSR